MRFDPNLLRGGSIVIVGNSGEVPHRAWIIMESAELEVLLGEVFLAWLGRTNPAANLSQAKQELIDEGSLGSLTKLSDIAFYLGLIGPKTRHDLRKIAKLRDRYAHDRDRGQLGGDPQMFKLVEETYLYKENRDIMRSTNDLHEQRAFLAICSQLKTNLNSAWVE